MFSRVEQIRMCSGPDEVDLRPPDFIDQQPVWFDVALSVTGESPPQWVVPIWGRQERFFNQQPENCFEFPHILSPSLLALDVLPELACVGRREHAR